MDVGTAAGIFGAVFGIIALVLVFVFRDRDRGLALNKIETRLEAFNQRAADILDRTSTTMKEMQGIRSASQQLRPEFSFFFATQWRFIEKVYRFRFEKHSISRKIASKYITGDMRILLDSGSTIDLVTAELLTKPVANIHIYSNNVFAAMHLAGTRRVTFHLFQGRFSERFAAVFADEANNRIDQLPIDLFIMAATALRFEKGIMVHMDDPDNFQFKKRVLEVFTRTPNSKLLIAADASKFSEPIDNHRGIVTPEEWSVIIEKEASRIVVITSPSAPDFTPNQRSWADQEIEKFRNAGIEVDIDM